MDNLNETTMLKELKELRQKLKFYEEFDLLTGLYNKDTFYEKTRELLNSYPNQRFLIFCVDIERFKMVNDLCGSEKGDEMLKYIAKRLSYSFTGRDTIIARIAADVYAVCMPDRIGTKLLEKTILEIFEECPFDIRIVPAIGVYPIEDQAVAVELMCDRAMLALNSIKGNFMEHLAIYNDRLRNELLEEHDILNRAEQALVNQEFKLYMQPKCNMKTGKIAGAEVLVRWQHPEKGIVMPGAFIPAFEKSGFIKNLDLYIWDKAASWLARRRESGLTIVPVSVNVSRVDILSMDVEAFFKAISRRYQLDPFLLQVEVTESAYTSNSDRIIAAIEGLMNNGFTVMMDDFGSGYSSLNLLKDINIDMLKLDMRFLDKTNSKSRDILESVVHMARWLKLRVIAEGVESQNQEEFLLNVGCEYAQGYYYYRPMPLEEFERLIDKPESLEDIRTRDQEENGLNVVSFKELFHTDVMTEQLMNYILGPIALYEYDGEKMRILRCNEEYYHVVCRDRVPDDLSLYNVIESVIEEDRPYIKESLMESMDRGDKGSQVYLRKNIPGEGQVWFLLRLFFLSAVNGKYVYYASVSDVTDQMKAVDALRLSEQRFRIAMEASGDTLFDVDIANRTAYYTERTMKAFGLSDCTIDAPEGFIRQGTVCPGYEDSIRKLYEDIYSGADQASCVIRAHMGDGSMVWNRITLIAIKDKKGKPLRAVGLVENLSREMSLEPLLRGQGEENIK